jgi:DNA polymerase-3 subunit delta'
MVGHEWAVELLQGQVKRAQQRHAYLITGPQGVGRRTLGLRLAQALNCPQPVEEGVPCGTCRTCRLILRMQHPDLSIVQADEIGGTLKVDQVRAFQHSLALAPYEARYRVALLLRFEEAHPSAANALLKVLEEPPPQVILILTAESTENLLPTIVSRCEVIRLRPLPLAQLQAGLQTRWGLPDEQAQLLAHVSGGRIGYAVQVQAAPELLEIRREWFEALAQLFQAGRVERFHFAEKAARDRGRLRQMLAVWLSYWRDVLLAVTGARVPLANVDYEAEILQLAARLDVGQVQRFIRQIEDIQSALEGNANSRLALEVLLLDMPGA